MCLCEVSVVFVPEARSLRVLFGASARGAAVSGEARAYWMLPPLEHAPGSGCLNCGSKPIRVPLRFNPHPGFGLVSLECDGETGESQIHYEKSTTFIHFENVAKTDPDHDWRVVSNGPLSDVVWQRHGPKEWVAIAKGQGFA